MRKELNFDTRSENGQAFVVIEDPVRSKYFQIGIDEFEFISELDGLKTLGQVATELNAISEEQAVLIGQWLIQSNLIVSTSIDSAKRLGGQAKHLRRNKMLGWLNPISFKIRLFNPNALLTGCLPALTWMFSKWVLAVWLVAALMATSILFSRWDELGQASVGILSGTGWIGLLVFWLLLKVVHEFAHGLACKKYGGEVPEAGILFLLFTPMAFVNVTSMWRLPSRWSRIVIAAAGMYVELFIAFVALVIWSRSTGIIADTAWQVCLMASLTTVLFNANPLMRFDGYFILSDVLGVPNLYPKGTRWFGDRAKHVFFGTPKTANLFSDHEANIVRVYGTLAWFWKLSISIGLIIAASVMFSGAGLLMGVVGAVMWLGLPIFKQFQAMFGDEAKTPVDKKRTAISCMVTAGALALLFFVLKAPATKSAPGLVQFSGETIVRAAADGFVDEILVANGAEVEEGQVLVRMHNDDLKIEIEALVSKLEIATIEARIHRQLGEVALAGVKQETIKGLQSQLAEKHEQAARLELRSPMTGRVFQRNLEELNGRFLKRGSALMSVANQATKELVVSVDQSDLESIKLNLGGPARVLLPGQRIFQSKIERIDPRASEIPAEIRLCAAAGGPLPVKPKSDSGGDENESPYILLSPRFSVHVPIDGPVARTLYSGQRGSVFFSATDQSLGSYLYLATTQWLRNKIEMAVETTTL